MCSMFRELFMSVSLRFAGPATTVEVATPSPPRKVVRTMGEAVSETGLRVSSLVLTPQQVTVLSRPHPCVYLHAPPGCGKTLLLLLKAKQWVNQGHHVHVVSLSDEARAVSSLIRAQLGQSREAAPAVTLHNLTLPMSMPHIFPLHWKMNSDIDDIDTDDIDTDDIDTDDSDTDDSDTEDSDARETGDPVVSKTDPEVKSTEDTDVSSNVSEAEDLDVGKIEDPGFSNTEELDGNKTEVPDVTNTEDADVSKSDPDVTNTEHRDVSKSDPDVTNTEHRDVSKSDPDVTNTEHRDVSKTDPDVTNTKDHHVSNTEDSRVSNNDDPDFSMNENLDDNKTPNVMDTEDTDVIDIKDTDDLDTAIQTLAALSQNGLHVIVDEVDDNSR